MKRKLALLMAFMMTAAIVPASHVDAASKNAMSKTLTAINSAVLDASSDVILYLGEDNSSSTTIVKGAANNNYFELELTGDAKWAYPLNVEVNPASPLVNGKLKGVKVKRLNDSILGVTVDETEVANLNGNHVKEIAIPMLVDLNGASEGPQVVRVIPKDSEVSAGEYTYTNIGAKAIKFRVQKKEKISRSGNTRVQMILDEVTPDGFNPSEKISLKLPSGFSWDMNNYQVDNASVALDPDGAGRILVVTPSSTLLNNKLESIYVNIAIVPDRTAPVNTDIDVIVQKNTNVSPSSLVVGEYVPYDVMVKPEKILSVIAGKDIEGLYRSKITIEEPATASLQGKRYMEFSFVDEKGEEVDASLQDGENLKLTHKAGDVIDFTIDNSSIADYGTKTGRTDNRSIVTLASGNNKDNALANEFDLYVNTQSTNNRSRYELDVPFVVDSAFEGKLFLKVKGAGAGEQLVQIADVKHPVTFEVQGALPQVKIGLQKQKGSDILIKETEAGALQDYVPKENSKYAEYNVSVGTKYNIRFNSGSMTVKEGDLKLVPKKESGSKDGKIYVNVDRRSTKASTLLVSGVNVTLDRAVPYGPFKLSGNFGVVEARHDLGNTTKKFDYFTVVTPVSDDKRITTVFTIDSKDRYVVNGVKKELLTMDVAPFIQDGRTMLPVRYIAEAIGAEVNYDPKTRIATFQKNQFVVTLNIDKNVMYVNGSPVQLYTKPANVEGRIFLPLVNVAQAFGLKQDGQTRGNIIWNQEKKTVTIIPQDATDEEYKDAKDGSILDKAELVTKLDTAAPAEEKKEEKKAE